MSKKAKSKIEEIPETAFSGGQLTLFQNFLCNTEEERDKLSNTIELWDVVPKYFISRHEMNSLRKNGILPTLERKFEYQGRTLNVKIRPARLTDEEGNDKEFYPSAFEELVEDALRKIATEQNHGFLRQQESGAVFSLHMLRQELKRRGHTRSYKEVLEALQVMSGSVVELSSADGKAFLKTSILPSLAGVSRDDWINDPKSRWSAFFSPLVTESIRALTYRQYDYHCMMSHTSQLSRWLHKRLAHNYSQAGLLDPYVIRFSTIQRDSGLLDYKDRRRAVYKLDSTLKELQKHKILMSFQKQDERGKRNCILDVKYTLTPDIEFVRQIKAANKRKKDGHEQLSKGAI